MIWYVVYLNDMSFGKAPPTPIEPICLGVEDVVKLSNVTVDWPRRRLIY